MMPNSFKTFVNKLLVHEVPELFFLLRDLCLPDTVIKQALFLFLLNTVYHLLLHASSLLPVTLAASLKACYRLVGDFLTWSTT